MRGEQLQSAQRKVDAYDRARARVKIEGATRAEYVLLAESALEQLETYDTMLRRVLRYLNGSRYLVGADGLAEDVEVLLSNPASKLRWAPPDPPGPHDIVMIGDEVRIHRETYEKLLRDQEAYSELLHTVAFPANERESS